MAWPTVTEACAQPFESVTWLAALQVVTSQCGGDPARLAAPGPEEFTAVVRAAMPAWGGTRAWGRIIGRVFAALTHTEGVVAWSRRGLLRRVADELGDLARTRAQLRAVEADMVLVLGELGLSRRSRQVEFRQRGCPYSPPGTSSRYGGPLLDLRSPAWLSALRPPSLHSRVAATRPLRP